MSLKRFVNDLKFDLFLVSLLFIAIIVAVSVLTKISFATDFSSKEAIMNRNDKGVTLYDKTGRPFFKLYDAPNKSYVSLSQTPKSLQQAVLSAEDKDFYKHNGFSVKSIAGAALADVKKKELAYGGSTITQQLAKNTFLSSNKDLFRK